MSLRKKEREKTYEKTMHSSVQPEFPRCTEGKQARFASADALEATLEGLAALFSCSAARGKDTPSYR